MIAVIITNQNKESVVLNLPMDRHSLAAELEDIGVRKSIYNIRAGADKNDVRVEFTASHTLGLHLLAILPKDASLDDVNTAAETVEDAHELLRHELEHNLLCDKYRTLDEMRDDIHRMTVDASSAHETYYFPLTGKAWDERFGLEINVSEQLLFAYGDEIKAAFKAHLAGDEMSAYYNEAGADKLLLTDWGFEEFDGLLYGKVDVYLTEPMNEAENQALRDWIHGQNSDGLGEGFEQQVIPLENEDYDGDFSVSFWHSGPDYFIKSEDEMQDYLHESHQTFGGM